MSRLENLVLGIIEKKAKKDEHTENFKKHIFEDGNINPNTLSSLKIDIDKKRVNLDGLNIDENQLNSIYIRTFIASLNKIIQEAYNRGYQDGVENSEAFGNFLLAMTDEVNTHEQLFPTLGSKLGKTKKKIGRPRKVK